jgi:hypothetical protein
MANIQGLAIIAVLVTLGSKASIAMPPQDIPAEVKSCKAISDDKDRLKCFDGLFGGPSKPPKPPDEQQAQKPPEEKQANWTIDETQSPDGNPEVVAANLVIDVELRINDQNPTKEVWNASINGRAAFAPDAIAFIRSLPDNAKLSIKTTRSTDGKVKEGKFNLGAVSDVRGKIAHACDWDNATVDEPTGSIDRQEGH